MGLRKASAYSKKKLRPYTRTSRVKSKTYIKVNPPNKIAKYFMGNMKDHDAGKHKFTVSLISEEKIQMRDNALEASRMYLTKMLDLGAPGEYFLALKVYPHHILRENKTAAGAGADRLSSGMKHSFGVSVGRAAIVYKGKAIFQATCTTDKAARLIRDNMQKIKSKLPCKTRILFQENK